MTTRGRTPAEPHHTPHHTTTPHHLPMSVRKKTRAALALASVASLFQPIAADARQVTATVYASFFHGRTTACGTTYSDYRVSAAHPWLPCGTRVRLSHRGRVLTVPITDRCDCSSIDLSYEAARRLGVPTDGIATVWLQEL